MSEETPSPPRRVTQALFDFSSENAEAAAVAGHSAMPRDNGPLSRLIDANFLMFASYTICHRAIPAVEDGFKPVQRRILHALHEKDDGRFIKVANIVGHTMQYHPHGDASIGDALVNLVNKRYLIEGQGNFGNIFTGAEAAAPRYIECRLTELARKEIFNKKLTEFIPSYDGRNQEPVLLPCKLPMLLMLGAEGIAVAMATQILPHNFIELLEAQIAIIQGKDFTLYPDFQTAGIMDVGEYNDGIGKLKIRARIRPRGDNAVVITELPYGKTTDTLIASIEKAIEKKKIQVKAIHDYTAENVEIELVLAAGSNADAVIKSLYAFTDCETPLSANIVVIEGNRPCERTVSDILRFNTKQLMELLKRELEIRRDELQDAIHHKTLIQIFVEERIYKRIEECKDYEAIQQAILTGFVPFKKKLRREITPDDIEMLLAVQIRRISLFDINKNRKEIGDMLAELAQVMKDLGALKPYSIAYLKRLIETYRDDYPRLTEIKQRFKAIDERALTAEEHTVKYDAESGYLGYDLRGGDVLFKCSSLDKIALFYADGRYKVLPPPDKLFVDKGVLLAHIYDRDRLYTAVYTDKAYGFAYIKRFTLGGVIMNRDYSILPEDGEVLFLREGTPDKLYVKYRPAKSQRIHQQCFTPADTPVKGVKARGNQLTSKAIARLDTAKPSWWDDTPPEN